MPQITGTVLRSASHAGSVVALYLATDDVPVGFRPTSLDLSRFTITVDGAVASIASFLYYEDLYLSLTQPIPTGASVTIAYRDSAGDQTSGVLENDDGTDVASTAQPLLATPAPIRQTVALDGAIFGIGDAPVFPEPVYLVYPDNDPLPTLIVERLEGSSAFVRVTSTLLAPNPQYSASATSGYQSYAYAGESSLIELVADEAFSVTVGQQLDVDEAVSWAAGLQVRSLTYGTIVSQSSTGASPQRFDILHVSYGGSSVPLQTIFNGFGWSNDSITGSPLGDRLDSTDYNLGNDTMRGMAGDDTLSGGAGDDRLEGGPGLDILTGGAGNDTLDGGTVADTTFYTDGNVAAYNSSPAGIVANLGTGIVLDGFGGTDTLSNITFLNGSRFDDTLVGSAASTFEMFTPGRGNDVVDGGIIAAPGRRISYSDATGPVAVNLATGTATGWGNDTFVNINQIRGSRHGDTLTGSNRTDLLEVFEDWGGNDIIDGAGGEDEVRYLRDATRAVDVDLEAQTALDSRDGTDVLRGIEQVRGSRFDDLIKGSPVANVLRGEEGNDSLWGRAGNDSLAGDAGNDTLYGESGNDSLRGGAGDDFLSGGDGRDSAIFASARGDAILARMGAGLQVQTAEGTDQLVSIERLVFSDRRIAFDLIDGNAGSATLMIGAVLGRGALTNASLVSAVVGFFDDGMSITTFSELMVASGLLGALAGGNSNTAVSRLLLANILNTTPDEALVSAVAGLVDAGDFTQASLLATAAQLDFNRANVDLVGLSTAGLELA